MRWDYAPLDINPVFPGLGEHYYYHYIIIIVIKSYVHYHISLSDISYIIFIIRYHYIIIIIIILLLLSLLLSSSSSSSSSSWLKIFLCSQIFTILLPDFYQYQRQQEDNCFHYYSVVTIVKLWFSFVRAFWYY